MKKIAINNKPYNIPEQWSEITLSQYTKAFKGLTDNNNTTTEETDIIKRARINQSKAISRLINEDDDFCMNLPLEIYAFLQDKMSFVFDISSFIAETATSIEIDGKVYELKDIREMTLRNYIDVEETIKDKENDDSYCTLLAVSLKQKGDETVYSGGNMEDFIEKVKHLPADKALPFVYTILKKKVILQNLTQASTMVEEVANQFANHTKTS